VGRPDETTNPTRGAEDSCTLDLLAGDHSMAGSYCHFPVETTGYFAIDDQMPHRTVVQTDHPSAPGIALCGYLRMHDWRLPTKHRWGPEIPGEEGYSYLVDLS